MKPKMKPRKKTKLKRQTVWIAVVSTGVVALIAWVFIGGGGQQLTASGAKLVHTMDPSYFSKDPKARAAYQVAEDMPEVLAELPCFCGCMTALGHESNLFCFRDEHGSACDICEDIALDARDMHAKGFSIERIKQAISERFGGH
jgi:Protein of unknown function with PCYCGC motif